MIFMVLYCHTFPKISLISFQRSRINWFSSRLPCDKLKAKQGTIIEDVFDGVDDGLGIV